jgi:hypothetical protein
LKFIIAAQNSLEYIDLKRSKIYVKAKIKHADGHNLQATEYVGAINKLDACHFYTSPGLAWQAALKMSGICLELITDPFMYNMFELGIRGGIGMVSKKYASANHGKIDDFVESEKNNHIMYLDANNLYGWAMSQYLPTGLMRFLSKDEIEQFDLKTVAEDSEEGYILEVDLEYPTDIHDWHNCYPLAPSHEVVNDEKLSPYSKNLWKNLNLILF